MVLRNTLPGGINSSLNTDVSVVKAEARISEPLDLTPVRSPHIFNLSCVSFRTKHLLFFFGSVRCTMI